MKYNLLEEKPKNILNEFLESYNKLYEIDLDKAKKIIKETSQFYNGKISIPCYTKELQDQWYNSLNTSKIDYSVYRDRYYFTDIWVCWCMYSRKYILSIKKEESIFDYFQKNVNSIVDLGCGLGYSTAMLKQMFPHCKVYGTNIVPSPQWAFGYTLSKIYDFEMYGDEKSIGHSVDLVFASEYFEHIEDANDNVESLIKTLNPKCLFLANSFNTTSLGHFLQYKEKTNSDEVSNYSYYDQKIASKKFNQKLKDLNYRTVKTKLWNNKPRLWIKNES